jgi:hypothetical protein
MASATDPTQLLNRIAENAQNGRCRKVLVDLRRARALDLTGDQRVALDPAFDEMEMACLHDLKRHKEVDALAQRWLEAESPNAQLLGQWVSLTAINGSPRRTVAALGTIRARDPGLFAEWPHEQLFDLLRFLRNEGQKEAAGELAITLVDIDYGRNDLEIADAIRIRAIDALLDRGDEAAARQIAARALHPEALETLLTLRRYSALWPELEARVGAHMATATNEALALVNAQAEKAGVAELSDEAAAAQRLLMQLHIARGELATAQEVGARAFTSPAALAAVGERGAWLVDGHAWLLAQMGGVDAADTRWRGLTDLGIETRAWLISMRINRVLMLMGSGRHAEVLTQIPLLTADAANHGSDYAMRLVRMAEVCALNGLGRRAETAPVMARLVDGADRQPRPLVMAHMCLGEEDKAAVLVLRALANDRTAPDLASTLQPPGPGLDPVLPSLTPLLSRPDVAAAYAKVARDLPEALRPPAG